AATSDRGRVTAGRPCGVNALTLEGISRRSESECRDNEVRNRSAGSEDFERRLRRPAEAGRVGAARIECVKSERTKRTVSRGSSAEDGREIPSSVRATLRTPPN